MKKAVHLRSGERAEAIAERFLLGKGLKRVERNFRCKPGEIDLVMRDGEYLVFVEVRYRKNASFGLAQETVSAAKQHKLGKAASVFLCSRGIGDSLPCRFDIVAIHGTILGHTINWIPDAFYTA